MAEVNETTDTGETSERRQDRELLQYMRIVRLFQELDPAEQRRAVIWLSDRFTESDKRMIPVK